MFSSGGFMVSGHTFMSLTHFEFIFVYCLFFLHSLCTRQPCMWAPHSPSNSRLSWGWSSPTHTCSSAPLSLHSLWTRQSCTLAPQHFVSYPLFLGGQASHENTVAPHYLCTFLDRVALQEGTAASFWLHTLFRW